MLKVVPIQTKTEQEAACARCGVAFRPDDMAYHALIDGELKGLCQFTMDGEGGHLHHLATVKDAPLSDRDRAEALFVLGRATLNFIDLCGVHKAYFEDAAFTEEGMIRSIGFSRLEDGRWFMDLEGFFTSEHCNCHG